MKTAITYTIGAVLIAGWFCLELLRVVVLGDKARVDVEGEL